MSVRDQRRPMSVRPSEVALLLLLLHRRRLRRGRSTRPWRSEVVVSSISWMISVERRRRRSRPRRSADSSRACGSAPCASSAVSPGCSGMRSSSTMISMPSRSTTGRSAGEVERHDRDVLEVDVLPDVELGPVRQREDADALALGFARVVERPQLGALVLRVPAVLCRCGSEKMRSLARLFSSSRRAPPKAASKPYLSSACFSPSVFHMSVCTRPVVERVDALPLRLRVAVDEQLDRRARRRPCRGTRTSPGTSRSCRRAAAGTAAGTDRRPSAPGAASPLILADRIEHHRALGLGDHLAHDVDALGLEPLEMRQ